MRLLDFADEAEDTPDDCLGFRADGQPTTASLANAIQVWSWMQNRQRVCVADAALAFLITPSRVKQAVDFHLWMLLTGNPDGPIEHLIIEHEGE